MASTIVLLIAFVLLRGPFLVVVRVIIGALVTWPFLIRLSFGFGNSRCWDKSEGDSLLEISFGAVLLGSKLVPLLQLIVEMRVYCTVAVRRKLGEGIGALAGLHVNATARQR